MKGGCSTGTEPRGNHSATTLSTEDRHFPSLSQAQVPYACITTVSGTFNSLSKVLCTFPSRYLFAIGLEIVLSFRWNVPPNLRSHPREHDSKNAARTPAYANIDGVLTLYHARCHGDLYLRACWNRILTPQLSAKRSFSM